MPARSGQSPVQGASSQPAVGLGFYLCRDMGRVRLCGVRHRRVRPIYRRLARQPDSTCQFRTGCPGAGHPRPLPFRGEPVGPSFGQRLPIRRHSLYGANGDVLGASVRMMNQYVAIRYTERLAEAGIEPSVGSVGDSYDNALAETINGLFKAEVIHRRGPWKSFEAVEYATLEWVDWFNNRRILEPIGNITPAEAEQRYDVAMDQLPMAA